MHESGCALPELVAVTTGRSTAAARCSGSKEGGWDVQGKIEIISALQGNGGWGRHSASGWMCSNRQSRQARQQLGAGGNGSLRTLPLCSGVQRYGTRLRCR